MKYRVRLTDTQKVDIMRAYTDDLTPMIELAQRYGITRQGVYKVLKGAGIRTVKERLPVSCHVCGKEVLRHKGRIRKSLHHFCSLDCYHAFLNAGNGFPFISSRYGQHVARTIVCQYFTLQEGHIVHHEDRNQRNNSLSNLRVFANQGDHIRHHRGFDSTPIWDGRYSTTTPHHQVP